MKRLLIAFAGTLSLISLTVSAQADEKKDVGSSKVLDALAGCRSIADNTQRLACFDRESATLIASASEGTIKVIDQEDVKTMRKSLFGFPVPRVGLFGGDKAGEAVEDKVLESTITSLSPLPRGGWRFTIAEGDATWQTTESPTRLNPPRVGQKVQLEAAALGSYWIRFNGQMGIKGNRVR